MFLALSSGALYFTSSIFEKGMMTPDIYCRNADYFSLILDTAGSLQMLTGDLVGLGVADEGRLHELMLRPDYCSTLEDIMRLDRPDTYSA
jgi:hypothetical protein